MRPKAGEDTEEERECCLLLFQRNQKQTKRFALFHSQEKEKVSLSLSRPVVRVCTWTLDSAIEKRKREKEIGRRGRKEGSKFVSLSLFITTVCSQSPTIQSLSFSISVFPVKQRHRRATVKKKQREQRSMACSPLSALSLSLSFSATQFTMCVRRFFLKERDSQRCVLPIAKNSVDLSCESDSVSVCLAYHRCTALLAKRALKLYKTSQGA